MSKAQPASPAAAPPPEPVKKRGLVGFLFKSVLGCSAFAVGSIVAIVLLLPTMLSGLAARSAGKMFAKRYMGSLEVAETKLAWFSEVEVRGAVLRDPEGRDVAKVSAVLPSIVDLLGARGGHVGRVVIDIDAELVADDAGRTNVQRALERRADTEEATSRSVSIESTSAFDPIEFLSRLDLELEIRSNRLSWSDTDTRKLGKPFAVNDLHAVVRAVPGQPLTVNAGGRIDADQPGKLEVKGKIAGPIQSKEAWPFGQVDLDVDIEGFSTAMVDGLAGLGGDLQAMLGPRFDLHAHAKGATPEQGDIALTLNAPRTSVAVEGTFAHGSLVSGEKPFLVASLPAPRGFLQRYVTPNLPAGASLIVTDNGSLWSVRIARLRLPIPPASARDLASLAPTLEAAEIDFDASFPGSIAFENASTRAAGMRAGVLDAKITGRLAPAQPLVVSFEARHTAGSSKPGAHDALRVELTALKPWEAVQKGEVPPASVDMTIEGVSSAAVAAFGGLDEATAARVRGMLGDELTVSLAAEAKNAQNGRGLLTLRSSTLTLDAPLVLEGGIARTNGEEKIALVWNVSPEFARRECATFLPPGADLALATGPIQLSVSHLEVAVPMPMPADLIAALKPATAAQIDIVLPGAAYTDATLVAAHSHAGVSNVVIASKLARGGALTSTVRAALDAGKPGALSIDLSTSDAWAFAHVKGLDTLPPVDLRLIASEVSTALVDALAHQGGLVADALGDRVALAVEAENLSVRSGKLHVEVDAPRVKLGLRARVEGSNVILAGDDDLHVSARAPAALVARYVGPYLPANSAISWPKDEAAVALSVRDVTLPLPDFAPANAGSSLSRILDGLTASVRADVESVGWSDEHTRAAKIDAGLQGLIARVQLKPGRCVVDIDSGLRGSKTSKLALHAETNDPFATVKDPAAQLAPIDAKLMLSALDAAMLDALAGQNGTIASMCGPEISLTAEARGATMTAGALRFDLQSANATIAASAKLENGVITCTGDEGVDATVRLSNELLAARAGASLPAGARLENGPSAAPLVVRVRDVRAALPMGARTNAPAAGGAAPSNSMLDLVAKLALRVEASLPDVRYTDAGGHAALVLDGKLQAVFAPDSNPNVHLEGRVDAAPPGEFKVDLRALDPLAKLADEKGLDTFRVSATVNATGIPTALVDVLAGQGGLLVEALGETCAIQLAAPDVSLARGPFSVDFRSEFHNVHGEGKLEDRVLHVDKVDGVLAHVGLGPLMSKHVVGSLVPMLFDVRKEPGAAPAMFAVDGLNFPIDADLSKLDAVVRVDLGEVSYKLLPGLESFLGESSAMKGVKVPPLTIPIKKGVASYDRLPIRIGGREFAFSGSYDLSRRSFNLATQVPLAALGKKVNAKLEGVRQFLPPDMLVPIEISGTWDKPRVGVGKDFLDKALENAAGKGLEGLLDGLGKKKKKD